MKIKKTVYICFSTEVVHGGHLEIIKQGANLGEVIIGLLTDEVIAGFKRFPFLRYEERKKIFENIVGVSKVVQQDKLSYRNNLLLYKPDYVVHGDDWCTGFQKPVRDEVIQVISTYGGELIEFAYNQNESYKKLEMAQRQQATIPDIRRGRLKELLSLKPLITVIEAHSGLTGLLAEETKILKNGEVHQFDAMWCSSLCDSTSKGKPDIELLDMSTRINTINEIMEVTTKPIIVDGDTGGQIEHFVYNIRTLERIGVSAVIIEDKTGLKKNSLFGNEVKQTQDSVENFSAKISAGKKALKTKDFLLIARVESLILEKGIDDALHRSFEYVKAGADGIMIHSRKKTPDEIFQFCKLFRELDKGTPLVVVPTSFNSVTEKEFKDNGVNVVIYANHFTRSAFPAMKKVAETILENERSLEVDKLCMPIKEIITLIPEE